MEDTATAQYQNPNAEDVDLVDETDFGKDDIPDWFERLGKLRDEKGVAWLRWGNEARLTLLRYPDIREAFQNSATYCKSLVLRPATFPFMGPNIQGYDGAEHRKKRALVLPAFTKRKVLEYVEPMFRPIANEIVDEFVHLGQTDLVTSFARKYPLRITAQLLGIPREDEDWLEQCALAMLAYPDLETVLQANRDWTDFILPILDQRRRQPGDDLISALLIAEFEGERLDEEEILGFLRLLFPAGIDTTWLTLGSMMLAVLEQPEIHQRLIANAEDRKWAVEETLRWSSATSSEPRVTMKDVVVCGVEIPAGQVIALCPPIGNRDPAIFGNADRWDLDRKPSEHLAFGLGPHLCLGAFLARSELAVALEVLLTRLPNLRLAGPAQISGSLRRGPRKLEVSWDIKSG